MGSDLDCLAQADPVLAEALRTKLTLATLLPWFRERGLPLTHLDLVVQDEFSHDLLIPLDDRRWLAFGIT